ncbi:MAG: ATP-binding protein [Pseudomonadota bacterium]
MKENHYAMMRNKILASMIIVPAIPFAAVVLIGFFFFIQTIQSDKLAKMIRVVEDHDQMIESFLMERKTDLEFVADSYSYSELTSQDILDGVFKNLQKKSGAFLDLGLFDARGLHIVYHGPHELAGKVYKDEPWFKKVMEDGFYISDVFLGYRQIPHFIMAVKRSDFGVNWVLRATIDTSLFSEVVEKIRIGKTGEAYLLNQEGKFQTQRRSGGELMEADPDIKVKIADPSQVNTFVERDASGDEYLYATTWLRDKHWLLAARQEKAEAFSSLYRATYLVIIVALLGGTAIVSIAFQVTKRIISKMETTDSEKNELGRQLVVAGRLAEIGEMSAGFAHEINNPLQIIKSELTLAETIMDDLKAAGDLKPSADQEQVEDSLKQIRTQVDRCGTITQGLLKFARKKESEPGKVDLKVFLPSVIRLVENKAAVEGIRINTTFRGGDGSVFADPGQLEQVLVNLLNNAIYAIVEKHGSNGGSLEVGVSENAASKVTISIEDNGSGISSENMEKIFTPFFTTKPVGKGTGLGLSICYGIITKMGGEMDVSSTPGLGTTFNIHLNKI